MKWKNEKPPPKWGVSVFNGGGILQFFTKRLATNGACWAIALSDVAFVLPDCFTYTFLDGYEFLWKMTS